MLYYVSQHIEISVYFFEAWQKIFKMFLWFKTYFQLKIIFYIIIKYTFEKKKLSTLRNSNESVSLRILEWPIIS